MFSILFDMFRFSSTLSDTVRHLLTRLTCSDPVQNVLTLFDITRSFRPPLDIFRSCSTCSDPVRHVQTLSACSDLVQKVQTLYKMFRPSSSWSHPVRHVQTLFDVCSDLFDMDRSGSISLHEFAGLFNYINEWKRMFEGVDTDRSGFIEAHEFAQGTAAF